MVTHNSKSDLPLDGLPIKWPRHRHFCERGSQKPPLKHKLSSQASNALIGMKLTAAEDELEAAEADLEPLAMPPSLEELIFRSMGRLASLVN